MTCSVRFTHAAARDLEETCDWIAEHDAPAKANHVLDRIRKVLESIATLPGRGSHLRELPAGMESNFRQLYFKPYRIIYEVAEVEVIVHVVADGRRNLQALLLRRLTSD